MPLNNHLYQLFWNSTKNKWNLIGMNYFKFEQATRLQLKFLRSLSFCNRTNSQNYLKNDITSGQSETGYWLSDQNLIKKDVLRIVFNEGSHYKIHTYWNCESLMGTLNLHRKIANSSIVLFQNGKMKNEQIKNDEKIKEFSIGDGTWKEVYKGVLTTQLKLLKMFSIGSSVIGLSMQPVLYEKLGNADIAIVVTLASFLGFFTFITPALIHWVAKKYVTKLEYDPERDIYAATTLSFFMREKKIHFRVEEVIRPEIPGLFTSFHVRNQSLFIDPTLFDDLDHYSRIMGLDQPIDFSIENDEKSNR